MEEPWLFHPSCLHDEQHVVFVFLHARGSKLVTSRLRADNFPGPLHHRSTILSTLGPDHALTVLFLGTHEQLPNGSPIMKVLWPPSRLTLEFQRNPKLVSSQKASC
ncbi:hypothetical protein DVH24_034638 [Malus domestica]|uniref:Uncharacterized protein n=1 Tax=Malus domestica TaxID=3750 RepID=A0A498IWM5_MALDO|nr:hypothetical protein DVH24_034638 [Malus domestica]